MSVLSYSTRLKTHAPSFPPPRSLSRQELHCLVSSCYAAKLFLIVFGVKDMTRTGILCPFLLPYDKARWIEKIKRFCKETHQERAVDQAGPEAHVLFQQAAPIYSLSAHGQPLSSTFEEQ